MFEINGVLKFYIWMNLPYFRNIFGPQWKKDHLYEKIIEKDFEITSVFFMKKFFIDLFFLIWFPIYYPLYNVVVTSLFMENHGANPIK